MNIAYVLILDWGEYDSHSKEVLKVFLKKQDAEKYQEETKELILSFLKNIEEIEDNTSLSYEEERNLIVTAFDEINDKLGIDFFDYDLMYRDYDLNGIQIKEVELGE